MEGLLKKRGKGAIASLKRRYCVVQGNELIYYKNQGDANPTGLIDLSTSDVSTNPNLPCGLDVVMAHRTYTFQATNNSERDAWIVELSRHRSLNHSNGVEGALYTIVMRGSSLAVPDHQSAPDAYFTVHSQPQADGIRIRTLVYKSEVVAQNTSPIWQGFTLDPDELGGLDERFKISVFDLFTNGNSASIGTVTTTLRALIANPTLSADGHGDLVITSVTPRAKVEASVTQQIKGVTVTISGISLLPKPSGAPTDAYLIFKGMPKVLNTSNPNRPTIIQRTEVALKSSNPTWQPVDFEVDVCGGLDAAITVECYDMDPNAKHDLLGTCSFSIRELVVSCSPQYYLFNLSKSRPGYKNSGILSIAVNSKRFTVIPTPPLSTTYAIKLCGKNLDNTETFGKSDPYFVIKGSPNVSASHPHNTAITHRHSSCMIYKSEVVPKTQSPNWGLFELNINLCGGIDAALTIEVYDNDDGVARLIGTATTSLRELISKQPMLILNNIQKSGNSYAGQLVVQDSTLVSQDSNPPMPHPLSYTLRCSASEVERSGILGLGHKSVPLFMIKGSAYNSAHSTIYKSEVVDGTTKPMWKSFTIEIAQTGGMDAPVTVELYSQESGRNELIGSFNTSLREISQWKNQSVFAVVNPLKSRPGYKNSGLFKIEELTENFPQGELPNIASLSISPAPSTSNGYPSSPPQHSYVPNSIYPQPTYVIPQQAAHAAHPHSVPTTTSPGYPPQYYPQQNSGHSPQNSGYPPQNAGYSPQSYNNQQPVYSQPNQGYPPQNYAYPPQNYGYPPPISVQAPQSAYPQPNVSAHPSNVAHLHPHQAQHNAFIHSGTSPTNHPSFPSAASSAVPRQNTSPQPSLQHYDMPPNPYDDPYNNSNPSLSLHPSGVGLRSSGTGQYPSSTPLRSSGTGQSPSSPPNSSLAPPATSPLRTSSEKSPKKDGASGGLALAGSIATAVGTPFLYGIR